MNRKSGEETIAGDAKCRSKKISYVRLSKVDIRFRQPDLDEFIQNACTRESRHSASRAFPGNPITVII